MSGLIPVADLSSRADMVAAYRARQARLGAAERAAYEEQARARAEAVLEAEREKLRKEKAAFAKWSEQFTAQMAAAAATIKEKTVAPLDNERRGLIMYVKPIGPKLPVPVIIYRMSECAGVTYGNVIGPGRCIEMVRARKAAIFLMRYVLNMSLPEIGRHIGNRDHTTIMSALRSVMPHINKKRFDDQRYWSIAKSIARGAK